MKNEVFLLIGGNLGDRLFLIEQAEILIEKNIGNIIQKSSIYESEPWGFETEHLFLNAVVVTETDQSPQEVLNQAQTIEILLGRKRSLQGYSARTMDVDILFFNDAVMETEKLIIPHPKLSERKFTLLPLCEIAAAKMHPIAQLTIKDLLLNCSDISKVTLFKKR
ncbi:MAG: 2-amino-4-hydroxy-6-hydroxymethyldihydropteridine diphosphokinase [Bacteroidales bacterium]|nr:2-amino-4-hydroxy-6-hydroxymethyldihydropteridine diphosphokinase [Bacteroidales bacterium]